MAQPNQLPKSPPATVTQPPPAAPTTSAQDIGRFIDILTNYMAADMRMHSADIGELQAISARIKASIIH